MTRPDPEGPLTPAVFHVLLALHGGPLHGYGILKAVEEASGIRMGPGTIYGTIQRLEEAGLVRETAQDDDPGETRRRYEATAAGRHALKAEAHRLTRLAGIVRAENLVPESEAAG